MFETRPLILAGVSLRGPGFGLKRAVFHAVDPPHLLEDLLSFMGKRIIHAHEYDSSYFKQKREQIQLLSQICPAPVRA
jgi:hypothetical protein